MATFLLLVLAGIGVGGLLIVAMFGAGFAFVMAIMESISGFSNDED